MSANQNSVSVWAIPVALAAAIIIGLVVIFQVAPPCEGRDYRFKIGGDQHLFFECIGVPPTPELPPGPKRAQFSRDEVRSAYEEMRELTDSRLDDLKKEAKADLLRIARSAHTNAKEVASDAAKEMLQRYIDVVKDVAYGRIVDGGQYNSARNAAVTAMTQDIRNAPN